MPPVTVARQGTPNHSQGQWKAANHNRQQSHDCADLDRRPGGCQGRIRFHQGDHGTVVCQPDQAESGDDKSNESSKNHQYGSSKLVKHIHHSPTKVFSIQELQVRIHGTQKHVHYVQRRVQALLE